LQLLFIKNSNRNYFFSISTTNAPLYPTLLHLSPHLTHFLVQSQGGKPILFFEEWARTWKDPATWHKWNILPNPNGQPAFYWHKVGTRETMWDHPRAAAAAAEVAAAAAGGGSSSSGGGGKSRH